MTNPFYVASGTPATSSFGASQPMRSEFQAIQGGFEKFPDFTGSAPGTFLINNFTATGITTAPGMLIDPAGNIGIGKTPAARLDILQSQNSMSYIVLTNNNPGGTASGASILVSNGANTGNLEHYGLNYVPTLVYRANGTALVGTGSGGLTLVTSTPQPLYFAINNIERMRIDTNGHVGIGTVPSATFDVLESGNGVAGGRISNPNTGVNAIAQWVATNGVNSVSMGMTGTAYGGTGFNIPASGQVLSNGANLVVGTNSTQPLILVTANTERMRINKNGTVGIATNVDGGWTGNSRFEVNNNGSAFAISAYSTAVTPGAGAIITRVDNTNVSLIDFEYNGTNVGRFVTDGVGLGIAYPNRFSLQAPVTIYSPADISTALVVAGSAAGLRFGTSGTTGTIEGVDQTGTAAYRSLLLGGSQVILSINNTERMRIDSNGNVGIGTTTPDAKLGIDTGGGGSLKVHFNRASYTEIYGMFGHAGDSGGLEISNVNYSIDRSIRFTNGLSTAARTERMRIDTAGNVGIGTVNPSFSLHIERNQNTDTRCFVRNSDTGNGASAMYQMGNDTTSGILMLCGSTYSGGGFFRPNGVALYANGFGGLTLATRAAVPIFFHTQDVERMRIDPDGRLLVNSQYPIANEMLCVVQNAASSYSAYFQNTSTAPGSALIFRTQFIGATPNNTGSYFFYGDDLTASRCYFFSNGGLANFSANNANISDARIKHEPVRYSEDELDALEDAFLEVNWGKFKFKDQTHDDWNHGPTAQGVEAAFYKAAPELVEELPFGPKDPSDPKGKTSLPHKLVYETDLNHISHALLARLLRRYKAEARVH